MVELGSRGVRRGTGGPRPCHAAGEASGPSLATARRSSSTSARSSAETRCSSSTSAGSSTAALYAAATATRYAAHARPDFLPRGGGRSRRRWVWLIIRDQLPARAPASSPRAWSGVVSALVARRRRRRCGAAVAGIGECGRGLAVPHVGA
jgi:hypothetical protein